eukprot:gene6379-7116_t
MADIQQMFYNFCVRENHRDYLRFIWSKDNDLTKEPTDYRMNVHVFRNKPSPSVAIDLLGKGADERAAEYGKDAKRNFYFDDGLISTNTPEEAVDLLKRTKAMFSSSNIKMHKVASNVPRLWQHLTWKTSPTTRRTLIFLKMNLCFREVLESLGI